MIRSFIMDKIKKTAKKQSVKKASAVEIKNDFSTMVYGLTATETYTPGTSAYEIALHGKDYLGRV